MDGLGVGVDWDETLGLLVGPEGKDWYLQVSATGDDGGPDRHRSTEVAEIVLDQS